MNHQLFNKIESQHFRKTPHKFEVGDMVKVHCRVIEANKERIQIFSGIVIGRRGHGINSTFTVRRISYGEGVERVFPDHSPLIEKVEVETKGKVRRAKLNYLRNRVGKQAMYVKPKEVQGPKNAAKKTGRTRKRGRKRTTKTASTKTASSSA